MNDKVQRLIILLQLTLCRACIKMLQCMRSAIEWVMQRTDRWEEESANEKTHLHHTPRKGQLSS